jgi:hypothetical protein
VNPLTINTGQFEDPPEQYDERPLDCPCDDPRHCEDCEGRGYVFDIADIRTLEDIEDEDEMGAFIT